MHELPNKCPHFNEVNRCGPVISQLSKQIEQVAPSSSSSVKNIGFRGDDDFFLLAAFGRISKLKFREYVPNQYNLGNSKQT